MRPSAGIIVPCEDQLLVCGAATSGLWYSYLFNLENVTRNDFRSLDFVKSAITKDDSLESQGLLQFVDNGSGLIFLDETNGGIEQEQGKDNAEVDPVLKTCSKYCGSLS
jgi:hypothetical protein